MACMKCGRKAEECFCSECLEQMKARPVLNPTVVMYRRGRDAYYSGKNYKKPGSRPAEELLAKARRKIVRQRIIILVLVLLMAAAAGTGWYLYKDGRFRPLGQNYNVNGSGQIPVVQLDESDNVSRETPESSSEPVGP